jgi:hypothetical protein
MLADGPGGVAVRTLAATTPVTFEDPVEALAAMGLGLDATGYDSRAGRGHPAPFPMRLGFPALAFVVLVAC